MERMIHEGTFKNNYCTKSGHKNISNPVRKKFDYSFRTEFAKQVHKLY